MVPGLDAGDTFAHFHHDACALMAEHRRKDALWVIARQGEGIGMADAGVGDLDQHLTFLGRGHIDLDHLQGLASFEGHGGTGLHGKTPQNAEQPLGQATAAW